MIPRTVQQLTARLQHDETAAAASEYAIVVAFVAAAIAAAVSQFNLGDVFAVVVAKVQTLVK